MVILGWTLIVILMGLFSLVMMLMDVPEEDFDRTVNTLVRKIRLRLYINKMIKELKKA